MRTKIVLSFIISAAIITILVSFEYFNFVQIRNEMRFLETTDSVRTKSLQLRRHEKNYFLYPDKANEELSSIEDYLSQLEGLTEDIRSRDAQKAEILGGLVSDYRSQLNMIQGLLASITQDLEGMQASYPQYAAVFPLLGVVVRDRPLDAAAFLQSTLSLPPDDPLLLDLHELDTQMLQLRDTGEKIIESSKDFDIAARDNAETGIHRSEIAILVSFPAFLLIGISTLLLISNSIVKKLRTLTLAVDKTGSRYISEEEAAAETLAKRDEADILIDKFKRMDRKLSDWEIELEEKNQELLQSKKLAAIGIMASGVAHEINNPLNNIQISAQVLKRQTGESAPPEVNEIVDDIIGQTARLKIIVGNLLEFARERELNIRPVELSGLARDAYELVGGSVDTSGVDFSLDSDPAGVIIQADYDQMQQVFVNLFSNAVAAMNGKGKLMVRITSVDSEADVIVADTGPGIPWQEREKVFDPFFSRKEKGTGLGLAIVMNTVIKHHGRISVIDGDTTPGAVFKLTFPKGDPEWQ